MKQSTQGLLAALLGILMLFIAATFRFALERSMPLHMLVQMPMLLGAGVACAFALSCVRRNAQNVQNVQNTPNKLLRGIVYLSSYRFGKIDEYGIVALSFFLLLSAYWMIPKALDDVLVSPAAELLKFVGFFLAGLILPGTWARANRVIQLFFLGNFAWMMAIVGMLYQDTTVRLCNAYLLDDQLIAGQGLVVLSIVIPALWCLHAISSKNNKWQGIF